MDNTKLNNYNSLDVAKLFMAVCVVAAHVNPFYYCNNSAIVNLYNLITNLTVQFFFICSGYLIGQKIDFSCENAYLPIKKSALKTLKLYVIWSIIYLPPAIIERLNANKSFIYNLVHYLKGLLLTGEHYNSWILWYLLSCFYALIFIAFLVKRKVSLKKITAIGVIFFVCYLLLSALIEYQNQLPDSTSKIMSLIDSSIGQGKPLQSFLYIPIGMCLSKVKIKVPHCFVVFVLFFGLSYFITPTVSRCFLPFTITALFGIIASVKLPKSKAYFIMRKLSTGIYFTHLYCWMFVYLILYGEKTYGPTPFFITLAMSFLISAIWIAVSSKINNHKKAKVNNIS